MAETTRASVLIAPKQFEVRQFELTPASADDGLLKVEACGVCGSDVHGWQRLAPGARILGHAFASASRRISRATVHGCGTGPHRYRSGRRSGAATASICICTRTQSCPIYHLRLR